jgi:sigma-B regulation protein RsbU (phosphoserine phosphatase)
MTICNAGHPRPLLYRAAQNHWDFLGDEGKAGPSTPCNLPLGLLSISEYEHFDVELEAGDCVLSYTDALIESNDASGEMLGEAGVLRITRLMGDVAPEKLIEALLREIADRYPENLSEDDVTVLLVRASGRALRFSFGEKLGALIRFSGSLLRAVDPRAERPPFPDANLANIGGAILPALGRRWRADRAARGPKRELQT